MKTGVIYKATNIVNGKEYIGQSINVIERIKQHKRNLNKYSDTKFYRAINKYGWDDFQWEILYFNIPLNQLNNMERWCISNHDTQKNGYNSTDGDSISPTTNPEIANKVSLAMIGNKNNLDGMRGKKHTQEAKNKISNANKGLIAWNKGKTGIYSDETLQKMSASKIGKSINAGRRHTAEHKQKNSDAHKGKPSPFLGKKHTEENKKKLSEARSKIVYEIIKPNGEIEIIKNLRKYCRDNNLENTGMYKVASGEYGQCNGYKCRKLPII